MPLLLSRLVHPVTYILGLTALWASATLHAAEVSPAKSTLAPETSSIPLTAKTTPPVSLAPVAPADLSAELAEIAAKYKVPGMVFLALRGDEIIAQGAAGVRQAGTTVPVTLADKFHLGSDTKAMTATLAAMLIDEGKLSWDSTLGELLGDSVPEMHADWKPVTLRQLLAHRSGLPRSVGLPLLRRFALETKLSTTEQRREMAAALLAEPPTNPPGKVYLYSNAGYTLLGVIVEKVSGRSWEELMRERLFKPLGITSGGFGGPGSADKLDQPRGHNASGQPMPAAFDNPAVIGPAGTAHMAIGDWAKFIALHLRGDPANPHAQARLLKPETFAAAHAPFADPKYNAGWGIVTAPWAKGTGPKAIGRVLSHDGSNTAWLATVSIAPEIDFAVLAIANRAPEEGLKAAHEATDLLIKKYARPSAP